MLLHHECGAHPIAGAFLQNRSGQVRHDVTHKLHSASWRDILASI